MERFRQVTHRLFNISGDSGILRTSMLTAAESVKWQGFRADRVTTLREGYPRSKTHIFQRTQGDRLPEPERPLRIVVAHVLFLLTTSKERWMTTLHPEYLRSMQR
ncbi:hypothetical protein ACNKHU_19785 [Shigella flexneri]